MNFVLAVIVGICFGILIAKGVGLEDSSIVWAASVGLVAFMLYQLVKGGML